ncbi:MAG TPA: endopeptidase La [Bdellovibrionales bacterium]|nr:MAG: endopeptidase La [Bdellovibrionales bacterium GWB1_52_6]OFZ06413.1 MAG: endopeptidase La [Bdellovibrionales bacterium GWA1_52_35]HAR43018.1 endopeptidase La [Bdellovibrionales bacterium]HCM40171.1 endopeptidase La [Bdellovibrionales bacterium]
MVTNYDGEQVEIPETLPMLPVRDIVVFPYMIIPLFVGRDSSIKSVEEALSRSDRLILLSSQKDISDEHPSPEGIYKTGTVAMIMRMRKLPDGRIKILTQGLTKAKIKEFTQTQSHFEVKIERIDEPVAPMNPEVEALMRNVRDQLEKVIALGRGLSPDIIMVLDDITDPGRMADLVASNLGLKVSDAQGILETHDAAARLHKISDILTKEIEVLSIQAKIRSQAKDEMTKTQKEYYLREQIRAIKSELGDTDNKGEEMQELKDKVAACKMPQDVEQECLKQLGRLERMHPDSSESSMLRTYVDWLIETPWSKHTVDQLDLARAKQILDEDHYNLQKIKERILEYLAVRKLKDKMKGPILCFSGPPGVGKTSLGRSIARALGREFVRISLGGVKDEAEIRGHRRTYVGALPGRIIQGLKQAGTNNPVFVLDEIDKLGSDFRGDPSAALLEVLDPEQNFSFRDHYMNVPFDLTNVMFITTCNMLETIPSALRDRMEVIQLAGYTEEEKQFIARKYLVPKQITENGLKDQNIDITNEAIDSIVSQYTREAGLRNLERNVASVCRKTARLVAEGKTEKTVVDEQMVYKFLGPAIFTREEEQEKDEIGIATGLAWTSVGGEILYVETTTMKGKGSMVLTGHLGDVMKESGIAALGLIRSRAKDFGIDDDIFAETDIHIHFPQGGVPKDGPSAGITMASAIISKLTGIPIRKDVAMTGEITLTGRVLPIGGLKEKALAAMRHGIKTIVIPEKNKKDLEDIPEEYRAKLTFVPVKTIDDVLNVVLTQKITPLKKAQGPAGATSGKSHRRRTSDIDKAA